jgi:hypothetical protein
MLWDATTGYRYCANRGIVAVSGACRDVNDERTTLRGRRFFGVGSFCFGPAAFCRVPLPNAKIKADVESSASFRGSRPSIAHLGNFNARAGRRLSSAIDATRNAEAPIRGLATYTGQPRPPRIRGEARHGEAGRKGAPRSALLFSVGGSRSRAPALVGWPAENDPRLKRPLRCTPPRYAIRRSARCRKSIHEAVLSGRFYRFPKLRERVSCSTAAEGPRRAAVKVARRDFSSAWVKSFLLRWARTHYGFASKGRWLREWKSPNDDSPGRSVLGRGVGRTTG